MGDEYFRTKCYWFNEYQDMNATVPTCDYYGQYGSCPCSDECEHYISEQEVENIIRRSKKGQWEYCKHAGISDVWKCDQCGAWMFGKTNYCPNCGARMKGGDDE